MGQVSNRATAAVQAQAAAERISVADSYLQDGYPFEAIDRAEEAREHVTAFIKRARVEARKQHNASHAEFEAGCYLCVKRASMAELHARIAAFRAARAEGR